MLTLSLGSHSATFHVAYEPAPLDVFYMRGPWLTWYRLGAPLTDADLGSGERGA